MTTVAARLSSRFVGGAARAEGGRADALPPPPPHTLPHTRSLKPRFTLPSPPPQLIGRINKCGVISPRFDVSVPDIEKWINNLLPSRSFGHIVLTTSLGIVDHEEARRKHTGGKVLGFFY